jgi:ankyrin repeat protein
MHVRVKLLAKLEKDLLWACANGGVDLVTAALDSGADITACDSLKMTGLHFACRHGHGEIVRTLLVRGADPNARDDKGVCPIHFAAYHGHVACVKALCDARADLTVQEGARKHGATPLCRAAGRGNFAVVEMLIKHGVKALGDASFPIHAAVSEGHASVAKLLLFTGGRLDELDDEGWSLLDCAGYEGHTDLMWLLLNMGARPAAHVCYLRPFLRDAIEAGDVNQVRELCVRTHIGGFQKVCSSLSGGVFAHSPRTKVPPTKTPAMLLAVQKGAVSVTEVLMEAELVDPNEPAPSAPTQVPNDAACQGDSSCRVTRFGLCVTRKPHSASSNGQVVGGSHASGRKALQDTAQTGQVHVDDASLLFLLCPFAPK